MKLSEARFSCLECGADNLAWPKDLEAIKDLTGDEPRKEVMDYLRCKRCGGEVTISEEEQRDLYMKDRLIRNRTLILNRSRYEAIVRVPEKLTICCTNRTIVLESNDDQLLGELAATLVIALQLVSEEPVIIEIPEPVRISLA